MHNFFKCLKKPADRNSEFSLAASEFEEEDESSTKRCSREARKSAITEAFSKEENQPKFLIVGAGVAGIACAVELMQNGFTNVVLVEAAEQIGGRILTVPFADNVIDLGAQWCHGQHNNIVYEMVKDLDLLGANGDNYVSFQCIRSNGEVVHPEIVQRLSNILADIFMNRHEELLSYRGSFGEYLSTRFYQKVKDEEFSDISPSIVTEFFENFKKIESSETAHGIDEVSGSGFDEFQDCEGDYLQNWKDKGYQQFISVLTKAKKNGNILGILEGKVKLSTQVEEIGWDRDDSKVSVKFKNVDDDIVVDHVIMTVSLGVLKANANKMFFPDLPQDKLRAIEGVGFGNVCKIFMEFPIAFWPEKWTGFTTLWRQEDYSKIRNTPNAWLEDVYGFYCVNYQPRVLVAWIVGTYVIYVESLTREELEENLMNLLKRFLTEFSIPNPVNVLTTSWSLNRNVRGAYSFRSMKTEKLNTGAGELAQPLTIITEAPTFSNDARGSIETTLPLAMKPVVMFAGEATSAHHYGTVHGAVETGLREANRMIGYYSLDL